MEKNQVTRHRTHKLRYKRGEGRNPGYGTRRCLVSEALDLFKLSGRRFHHFVRIALGLKFARISDLAYSCRQTNTSRLGIFWKFGFRSSKKTHLRIFFHDIYGGWIIQVVTNEGNIEPLVKNKNSGSQQTVYWGSCSENSELYSRNWLSYLATKFKLSSLASEFLMAQTKIANNPRTMSLIAIKNNNFVVRKTLATICGSQILWKS